MQANRLSLRALPLLILPPLFWAGNFVVGRAVRGDIPPLSLSFWRWVIAFFVLLPFAWRRCTRDFPLYRQHKSKILAVSAAGVAAFNTLVYVGLHSTSTTNALLLNSCIPVLIMLFGLMFYRQKLQALQLGGLMLSLGGVLTIILHGEPARLAALQFNPGDLLVFSAMVSWAFYTLWMKTLPAEIDRIGLMLVQIALGIILLLPLWLWEKHTGTTFTLNPAALLALAYVGILPSVAAYLLYTFAVQTVGAVRAGLSIHLMPVFGVALSVLFLGESLYSYHIIGIALIISGLVLSNKKTPQ